MRELSLITPSLVGWLLIAKYEVIGLDLATGLYSPAYTTLDN
jgi:hypothetical protein